MIPVLLHLCDISFRSFQRDTSHHIEDWLTLEPGTAVENLVKMNRDRELIGGRHHNPDKYNDVFERHSADVKYSNGGDGADSRHAAHLRLDSLDGRILLALFIVFLLLNVPWMMAHATVLCRSCWAGPMFRNQAVVMTSLQTVAYLSSLIRPIIYHTLSGHFRRGLVNLIGSCSHLNQV